MPVPLWALDNSAILPPHLLSAKSNFVLGMQFSVAGAVLASKELIFQTEKLERSKKEELSFFLLRF